MSTTAGPKRESNPERAEIQAKARLGQAVWEASQFLGRPEILEYVEDVLREIEDDAA